MRSFGKAKKLKLFSFEYGEMENLNQQLYELKNRDDHLKN